MANVKKCMLTTFDNPFDPFTQFDEWLQFDNVHDYGTCEYLARFCFTSDSLSENENAEVISDAIDGILLNDPRKIYVKIFEDGTRSDTPSKEYLEGYRGGL